MHLILHIGTEKTGTKSIQSFLSKNREELLKNRILVPESLGKSNHRLLAGIAMNDSRSDDLFQSMGLSNEEERKAIKTKWLDDFYVEIDNKKASFDTIIITSEHLQSRLSQDSEIHRLKELIAPICNKITVLVYLREPVATALSAYSTSVKYGSVNPRVPDPDKPYFFNLVNHEQTTKRWSGVFGSKALHVRLYERDFLKDGDVVSDFINATDLPPSEYVQSESKNRSLDALGIELLLRINKNIPQFKNHRLNLNREGIIEFFEKHFSSGPSYNPDNEIVKLYQSTFLSSNEYIRQTYFPNRTKLFTPYTVSDKKLNHFDKENLDNIAMAIEALWKERATSRSRSSEIKVETF